MLLGDDAIAGPEAQAAAAREGVRVFLAAYQAREKERRDG